MATSQYVCFVCFDKATVARDCFFFSFLFRKRLRKLEDASFMNCPSSDRACKNILTSRRPRLSCCFHDETIALAGRGSGRPSSIVPRLARAYLTSHRGSAPSARTFGLLDDPLRNARSNTSISAQNTYPRCQRFTGRRRADSNCASMIVGAYLDQIWTTP